jgi:acyl-CoA synthetase (AMP-forming)/AMP-acid ligase II
MHESTTLLEHIENVSKNKLSKNAYIFVKDSLLHYEEITYSELISQAKKVAAFLLANKLYESKVILCYSTGIDFIVCFLGCLYANAIAVIVPFIDNAADSVNKTMFDYVQDVIKAKMILADKKTSDKLGIQVSSLKDILNSNMKPVSMLAASSHTITHMLLTSGSTSDPKIVVFDHKCLLHNLYYTSTAWEASSESRHLSWGAAFHSAGLMVGYLLPIFNGTTGVIFPSNVFLTTPMLFPILVSKFQITHTACPNFAYDYLIDYIDSKKINTSELDIDLSNWRVAIVGGDPLQETTLYKFYIYFKKYGFTMEKFRTAYGMTEATGLITATGSYSPLKISFKLTSLATNNIQILSKDTLSVNEKYYVENQQDFNISTLISCGKASCDAIVIVVDPETGRPVQLSNSIGDVYFSSPSLFRGYWDKKLKSIKDATVSFSWDNERRYLATGDKGFMLENEIFILGRESEIIYINNKAYFPIFIELLAAHSYKGLIPRSNIAFSVINKELYKVILVQELPNELIKDMLLIQKSINQMVLKYYNLSLTEIIFIEDKSLPKIPGSGKMQRNLCKKLYLANQLKILKESTYESGIA